MSKVEERLKEKGLSVPQPAVPVGAYAPAVQADGYIYTSGQLPLTAGELRKGKLGQDISVEDAYKGAQTCCLNALAAAKAIIGDLDRIERVVKVVGFVNSTLDFTDQPKVINGASELLRDIFGEAGIHARSAVGCACLPLGACCEVELILKIKG